MLRGCWSSWGGDPGPCPVDDTPHTACTSPDYAGTAAPSVTMPIRRPAALDTPLAPRAVPALPVQDVAPVPTSEDFSTKTYRRATHGKRLRGGTGGRHGTGH